MDWPRCVSRCGECSSVSWFFKGNFVPATVLAPMANKGSNPWDFVLSILEGKVEPEDGRYRAGLRKAREKWHALKSRQELLSKLARFELSPSQVERIANPDLRTTSGIGATETELVSNPYILSENDLGTANSEPVALETIDHGMWPRGNRFLPDDDEIALTTINAGSGVGVAILKSSCRGTRFYIRRFPRIHFQVASQKDVHVDQTEKSSSRGRLL